MVSLIQLLRTSTKYTCSAILSAYTLWSFLFNPLNAELNPICHLLALVGAHHIFHVSGLRVKFLNVKQPILQYTHNNVPVLRH